MPFLSNNHKYIYFFKLNKITFAQIKTSRVNSFAASKTCPDFQSAFKTAFILSTNNRAKEERIKVAGAVFALPSAYRLADSSAVRPPPPAGHLTPPQPPVHLHTTLFASAVPKMPPYLLLLYTIWSGSFRAKRRSLVFVCCIK